MGMLKNMVRGAVVAKVVSEAMKPQNQAKAKKMYQSWVNKSHTKSPAA